MDKVEAMAYKALHDLCLQDLMDDVLKIVRKVDSRYEIVRLCAAIYIAARQKGYYVPVDVICNTLDVKYRKRVMSAIKRSMKGMELDLADTKACARYIARVIAENYVLDEHELFEKIMEIVRQIDVPAMPFTKVVAAAYLAASSFRVPITQRWLAERFGVSEYSIRKVIKEAFGERAAKLKYSF